MSGGGSKPRRSWRGAVTDYKAYCRDQPCQTETVHQVQGLRQRRAAGFIGRRSPTMPPTDSHAECSICRDDFLMSRRGEEGGPLVCIACRGKWHAEHGKA
jgi:hypothetical protein